MNDPRLVVLAAAVMKRAITEADADARERLLMMLDPGTRLPVSIDTPGGKVKLGSITVTEPSAPKSVRKVTDPAAFLAWVKENRPDEVIHTEAVRSSYTTAVLGRPKADENGEEIPLPPGVEWRVSAASPTVQVRPSDDAAKAIAAAVAAGTVSLDDVLAIGGAS